MNDCPECILYQILSKLPIKEAGSTSVLSKRWRYLFASQPDLHFDDFTSLHPQDKTSFVSFVDRVLELRGNVHINKFSLKCGEHILGVKVSSWISKVLSLGVSDLVLHISPEHVNKSFLKCGEHILECDPSSWISEVRRLGVSVTDLSQHTSLEYNDPLPSEVFVHKELVSLEIGPEGGPSFKLEEVSLPKLKTLNLESFTFEKDEMGFAKLLSGCPVLEELDLPNLKWNDWDSCFVSSKTLERLMLCSVSSNKNPKSVSLDTPNVVYLEYSDNFAYKYPVLNFDSLVEAHIDIKMTYKQRNMRDAYFSDEETDVFSDAKVLLMGICNVKILYISYQTLETLNFCCEAIPVFNNLNHLTIDSHNPLVGWKSLPELLKNSPNLETVVFQGLNHQVTDECGDMCLCHGSDSEETDNSSLSQCSVKFLTISNFGEAYDSDDDEFEMEKKIENIEHFLEKMPNLEQLIIWYNLPTDDPLAELSSRLQKLERVASPRCNIQIISDNITFSTIVPTSLSIELGQLHL